MKYALIAFLMAGCSMVPKELSTPLGCKLPPRIEQDSLRYNCEDIPQANVSLCAYVGYEEPKSDQLCVTVVASRACGDWEVVQRVCGVAIGVQLPRMRPAHEGEL